VDPENVLELMGKALAGAEPTALSEIGESMEGVDPFRVLIGTILSHRTRDEKTGQATERLFRAYVGAGELACADRQEVARLIKGVGFYNVKSGRVIEVARRIRDEYGGIVPDSIEELMKLPAVGRKTANCVLVYGFGREAIPVDTHVHRISNRLGIARTKSPDETEAALRGFFPQRLWLEVNDTFVRFGKAVCKPIGPRCKICPLSRDCEYFRNAKKRPDYSLTSIASVGH
jgi:endonuclease-3